MDTPICVCGAGTMGSGIAQVFATSGFPVKLFDIDQNTLDHARSTIEKNLNYLVSKGKIDKQQKSSIYSKIDFISGLDQCTAFIIIEAIVENKRAKIDLFNNLAAFNNEEVIFASNTSSISISEIQKEVPYPQRVAGMHFFNPAYIMPLVEIIRGEQTDDAILQELKEIVQQIGKRSIICKDAPGFIVNRVARPYYLEPLRLLENGVATFEEIDIVLEATGFRMGPFRLMDLIGMDINLATSESVYEALGKPSRLEPSRIQREKTVAGELGKKTGKGFYDYENHHRP